MWTKLLFFGRRMKSLLRESLTKEELYKEVSRMVQGKIIGSFALEELYKNILSKKFINNTVIESQVDNRDTVNLEFIEGYRNMADEEEYILKLITEKYNRETSIANWKMNLHLLKGNYKDLEKDKSVYIDRINSYITGYSFIDNIKNNSSKKTRKNVSLLSNYSPEKAVEYAITYAFNYNTAKYPNYAGKGGDCANFISQVLHAGGKPMNGTNASNFNNWFCRSNRVWDVDKISSTWRGADAFGHYWMRKAVSYKSFDRSYFSDNSKLKKVLEYGNRGDAVSILNSNGRPFHTLIIIDYAKDDLICAAHSGDTVSASLRNYGLFSGGIRIYKMGQ